METRKPEVFVDPTEAQRAEVAAMTGVTVPDSAAAVAVQSSGGDGYRIGVVPGGTSGKAEIISEDSETAATQLATPELSNDAAIAELSKPLLRAGEAGLIGPPGSAWGSRVIYMTMNGGFCMTEADFKYDLGKCQSFRSSCESTFYVYWVDGSEPPPHYLVILRQKSLFGVSDAGAMVKDERHVRGFGMYSAKTEVRNVNSPNMQVQLVHVSPPTNGRVAQVNESVRITQDMPGGQDFGPATMQEGAELSLEGWTAYNRSAPPDAKWEFAQNSTLDGGLNGRSLTDNHYMDQFVKPFPTITASGLTARTYAVWRVRGGKDAKLNFGLELLQSFMILALGWMRKVDARGGVLSWWATGLQPYSLDLAEIAKPKK